ncbi:MAG: four helix bundle protein [Candidatus Dojkabacteria bacterium]
MFDFEKFPVYLKTEDLITSLQPFLKNRLIHNSLRDQLYRASSSILLNIAEGAGKYSSKDKKNFYIIARGSTQECVAIIKLLKIEDKINEIEYSNIYSSLVIIGKMLSGLINKMLTY